MVCVMGVVKHFLLWHVLQYVSPRAPDVIGPVLDVPAKADIKLASTNCCIVG